MKKFYTLFVMGLLLVVLSAASFAFVEMDIKKHPFVLELKKQLTWFAKENQTEKLYLHFDKTSYQPGEIIWYKLYLRDADRLKAEGISELVYVELISPKGTVQEKLELLALDGNTSGSFQIAATLPGGRYKVKAYTNWMKNSNSFFEKDILVQKLILPNLNRKLEFERKAYGGGDEVLAKLELESLENVPLRYTPIDYTVSLDGEKMETQSSQTDFDGKADIRFQLPENLNSSDGILTVGLTYKGQRESITRSIPIVLNNIDLQFFAESGDLIHGLPTRLAFKAVNEFGKASDFEGEIFNAKDQVVFDFKSFHNGMGKLGFIPDITQSYYAKITKPEGIDKKYDLPLVLPDGFAMNVLAIEKEKLKLKLQASQKSLVHLIAQSGDRVIFSKSLELKEDNEILIPTQKFPIGISRLTLFDEAKNARCERLVFLNKHKQLKVDIQLNKEEYAPRERVDLGISIKDENGDPVRGNFSLAVADEKLLSFVDDKQANILASLLLESELKGEIEEPNFYFDREEAKADLALDLLMMTQGWRRFDWQLVQNATTPIVKFPKEQAIVRGKVLDENLKAITNATVKVKGTTQITKTNASGEFTLSKVDLTKTNAILDIQAEAYGLVQKNVFSFKDTIIAVLGDKGGRVEGIISQAYQRLSHCKIELIDSQKKKWILNNDKFGAYAFHQIPAGQYDLRVSRNGYQTRLVKNVKLKAKEVLRIDLKLKITKPGDPEILTSNFNPNKEQVESLVEFPTQAPTIVASQKQQSLSTSSVDFEESVLTSAAASKVLLDVVTVTEYKVPLISQDNTTSGAVVSAEEIRNLPTRSINAIAAKTVGISSADEGEVLHIKGGRSDGTVYYIDGIRVSGNLIPSSEVDRIEVMTGGLSAAYGGGEAVILEPKPQPGKMALRHRNYTPSYEQATGRNIEEIQGEVAFGSGKKISYGYYNPEHRPLKTPKKIFTIVDQLPRFYDKECEALKDKSARESCAEDKMMLFINEYLSKYNHYRTRQNVQAVFRFFVNKNGKIGYPSVHYERKKGVYFSSWKFSNVIHKIPKWVPAKNGWKKVACWYTIPIDLENMTYPQNSVYHQTRKFYAARYQYRSTRRNRKKDYRSTIHWAPNVETDQNGKAKISFWNSDAVSSFRITLEGLSTQGQLAQKEEKYFTQLPISLQVKAPFSALQGDQLQIPISLSNNTNQSIKGRLSIQLPAQFKLLETMPEELELEAKSSKTVFASLKMVGDKKAMRTSRWQDIVVKFKTKDREESFNSKVLGFELGYPIHQVFTDTKLNNQFKLNINNPIKGTLQASLKAYPNRLSEIVGTLDKMLRQPYGCFEQTSSITYPNILAYNLLKQKGLNHPNVQRNALDFIHKGRDRLMGFEVKGGGFDWYGRGPAHEGLTAYGLLEFVDMKKVVEVEDHLIERTVDWLLKRRDGNGGWKRRKRGSFGNGKPKIGDAYVVWSMCEAGFGKEIPKEIEHSYRVALKTKDNYILALMANALYAINDPRAEELMNLLLTQRIEESCWEGKQGTISGNSKRYNRTETTALVALALMKKEKEATKILEQSINFLLKQKNQYGFGSTQSTILVLKALVEYSMGFEKLIEPGKIKVFANGRLIGERNYSTRNKQAISMDTLDKYLVEGSQDIAVVFENTSKAIPFEIELKYQTLNVLANDACKLRLSTSLKENEIRMGETVRLETNLRNLTTDTLGNAIAMIGIPAGLSLQTWQLKEIQDKALADYYEIFDGKLVLHFINMMPSETKKIKLDLKADIPGQYNAYASSAYLYYDNEAVFWTATKRVSILP